jgi:hypothetical protein
VLVITLVVMLSLFVFAAYAIDTGIWFVHHRHLQTEADAAALAAAQNFQYPCTVGGTMDQNITASVHQYDGTTAAPNAGSGYNPQVSVQPTAASTYSSTSHNLISLVNKPNFVNQSVPADPPPAAGATVWQGPCGDAVIDVKASETNLASFLPFVSPAYINAQARVSIQNLISTNGGLAPLAEPLPTPNAMTAYLIDEGNSNQVLATISLSPVANTNNASWAATNQPFTFNAKGPVGMEIAEGPGSGTVPCNNSNGNSCYDTTDTPNIGITYTRVWSHSTTPGQPAATTPAPPQIDDASFDPTTTTCPTTGTFSNFISTSGGCTVKLKVANVQFAQNPPPATGAPAIDCSNAGLTVTVGAGSPQTLTCPGTPLNGKTWTTPAINVTPSSGPTNITLGWSLQAGNQPSGSSGGSKTNTCTPTQPCTGTFGVVQRVFSGAYDSQSATSSNSGGILAASLTDSSGVEIQSTQNTTTATTVNIAVNVLSFQNSQSIPSAPIELSFGGNQANGLVSCPGQSAGGPAALMSLWKGCQPPNNNFALNANFSTTPCNPLNNAAGASLCLPVNSGNGKLDKYLDDAMQCRINGSSSANSCQPVTTCVNPNYWAAPNTIPQLLSESPADPRLVELFVTDYGALGNGRTQVPIRVLTDFYVTGWQGDPCIGKTPGSNSVGQTTGGSVTLNYVGDDAPSPTANNNDPAGVLLGHFVQYTTLSSGGTGSGQCVQSTTLGNCIAVLTR